MKKQVFQFRVNVNDILKINGIEYLVTAAPNVDIAKNMAAFDWIRLTPLRVDQKLETYCGQNLTIERTKKTLKNE